MLEASRMKWYEFSMTARVVDQALVRGSILNEHRCWPWCDLARDVDVVILVTAVYSLSDPARYVSVNEKRTMLVDALR